MQRGVKRGLWVLTIAAALVGGGQPAAEAAGFSDYELGEFYPLAAVDDAVVHELSEAVVRFPTATGFLVDPEGLIMTNHHVYESFGQRGTVWRRWVGDGTEQALNIELVTKDRRRDVALYRVVDAVEELPFIELRASAVVVGEPVFILGHPDGEPLRASYGQILADGLEIGGRPSLEYSAQTWWGSSGSPVLDRHGRLLAIHWGWDSEGLSNGRLTGVPTAEFMGLEGFAELGLRDPAQVDCSQGWSIDASLVREEVRQNGGGRWLDEVELRAIHAEASCEATLEGATFRLHPSFRDPVKSVDAGEALTIYSWGFFEATVELELAGGAELAFVDRVAWK